MAKKSTNPAVESTVAGNNPFAGMEGEQFGGQNNYLQMEVGTRVDGFKHVKIEKDVILEKGNRPVDLHIAIHPDTGLEIRMPAAAVFRINMEKADLKAGDEYSVARLSDAIKKSPPNKGKKMDVYALLVTKRASKKSK